MSNQDIQVGTAVRSNINKADIGIVTVKKSNRFGVIWLGAPYAVTEFPEDITAIEIAEVSK